MPTDRPLRVLACEDDPVSADLLARLIVKAGHSPTTASHGRDLLRRLAEDPHFDAIILDLDMPIMDGLEAARRIRLGEAGPEIANVFIVVLTGVDLDYLGPSLDSLVDMTLKKPVRLVEIAATLEIAAQFCDGSAVS